MENKISKFSLLYPSYDDKKYKIMSAEACHDSGLDTICTKISAKGEEQRLIMNVLSTMTDDRYVSKYRCDVFADIYTHKKLREELSETLEHIRFLQDFGSLNRETGEMSGIWELLHRLDEIKDYITCVETIFNSLSDKSIQSEGLINLRKGVEKIYNESRDSYLTINYFDSEDGVCRTAFASVSNQVHECRQHTCENAWKFISQFRR